MAMEANDGDSDSSGSLYYPSDMEEFDYNSDVDNEPAMSEVSEGSDSEPEVAQSRVSGRMRHKISVNNALGSEHPVIIQRSLDAAAAATLSGSIPVHQEYYSDEDEDPDDPIFRMPELEPVSMPNIYPIPDLSNEPGLAWPKPPVVRGPDKEDGTPGDPQTNPPSVQWREEPYRTPTEAPFKPILKPGLNPNKIKPFYSAAQICMNLLTVPFGVILKYTNKAGVSKKGNEWKEISMGELTRWFAVYLSMTILCISNYREYWNLSDEACLTPGVRRTMSRNRFNTILQYLRCSDTEDPAQKRGSATYDRLAKIRPIWEPFWEECRETRGPDRILSMDESMAKFYGKFAGRMTIPNKPNPVGIRMWCLNDPESGFCYGATVYVPRNPANKVETALIDWFGGTFGAVWYLLMSGKGFFNQGYIVVHDNFYTMMRLMKQLLDAGVYTLGTVCHTRQFPTELIGKKKLKNVLERGEMVFRHADNGITIVVWKDNNVVTMAYTVPNIVEQTTVAIRRKKTDKQTGLYLVKIAQPYAVKFYNTYMAGTDRFDQHTGVLNHSSRHKKWPLVLIKYILNTAMFHTWVLQRDFMTPTEKKKYFLRQCVAKTVEGLLSFAVSDGHVYRPRIRVNLPTDLAAVMGGHWTCKGPRGYCHLHGRNRRIQWMCEKCRIYLCPEPCMKLFHTSPSTTIAKARLRQIQDK